MNSLWSLCVVRHGFVHNWNTRGTRETWQMLLPETITCRIFRHQGIYVHFSQMKYLPRISVTPHCYVSSVQDLSLFTPCLSARFCNDGPPASNPDSKETCQHIQVVLDALFFRSIWEEPAQTVRNASIAHGSAHLYTSNCTKLSTHPAKCSNYSSYGRADVN